MQVGEECLIDMFDQLVTNKIIWVWKTAYQIGGDFGLSHLTGLDLNCL